MSVFTALYNLLIGPLELLFQVIFAVANGFIGNPGLSIIFLSLVVNFLVLPLYKQADAMQAQERDTELKLKQWVTHIKKTFKGDERFMMLQTYYRQNHYKPTDALKGSVSLLLEIPFFMAAYRFLSGLQLLNGVSFGPIGDLGRPDAMLVLGGLTIHVLPILMTVINLISGMIYTKGQSLKSKIQLYAMALIFLVLLYESPAGLVFYWTLNNLFSLVKNVFYRLKNPKWVLSILSSLAGVAAMAFILFVHPMGGLVKQVIFLCALLVFQLPMVIYQAQKKGKELKVGEITKKDKRTFFGGCIFAAVFVGGFVPLSVIAASPEEFVNTITFMNPLLYVLNALLLATGVFVVWFGVFYTLAKPLGKRIMEVLMWVLSGAAVIDYMFFGQHYGTLSAKLKYDLYPTFAMKDKLLNLLVIVAAAAVLYFIWKKKKEIVRAVYLAAILAVVGMSIFSVVKIQPVVTEAVASLKSSGEKRATIPMSKNGKNVVILMMDRAIGSYTPYIFQERPELKEQFAGFTYYPNTMSYGAYTNIGVPPVFGGYEYTPTEMNRRDKEYLKDKHNEALKVMPVMFKDEDYTVTVCDPTYAGYKWIPDLTVYEDYPEIRTFITEGKFNDFSPEDAALSDVMMSRNLFCYSVFKVAPVIGQPILYNDGAYNDPDAKSAVQLRDGMSKATGTSESFMSPYNVLRNLPEIVEISEGTENTFMMMSNNMTHEPMLLQAPDYKPGEIVDNTKYDAAHTDRFKLGDKELHVENDAQMIHYQTNVAAMMILGDWMDYLRENDLYDNTRIIIVADHGRTLYQRDDMMTLDMDMMSFNPLLMVKDFGSTEFRTDDSFMTNGDVPTLATKDLIDNPTNPFTGKPINSDAKKEPEQHILYSTEWDVSSNNGTTFMDGRWFTVHDNIFDKNNWGAED